MTPQERQLVDDLFDRLARLENTARDPDATAAIEQGLRKAPNAVYALVQTVLLQDEALKRANSRIQELEQAQEQARAPQQSQSGGFLDSMRETIFGQGGQRGSVPNVPPPASRPVWNSGQVLQQPAGQYDHGPYGQPGYGQGGYGQGPYGQGSYGQGFGAQPPFGGGGSFLAEEIAVLEPDDFCAAEKREGLKGLAQLGEGLEGFGAIVDGGVNEFVVHAAQLLAPVAEHFAGALLDSKFVLAANQEDGGIRDGGGRHGGGPAYSGSPDSPRLSLIWSRYIVMSSTCSKREAAT